MSDSAIFRTACSAVVSSRALPLLERRPGTGWLLYCRWGTRGTRGTFAPRCDTGVSGPPNLFAPPAVAIGSFRHWPPIWSQGSSPTGFPETPGALTLSGLAAGKSPKSHESPGFVVGSNTFDPPGRRAGSFACTHQTHS